MFDVFQARERGEPFTHEVWKHVVVREAGPNAADEFERIILKGETLLPASDAFGPCFERRPAKVTVKNKEQEMFEWVRVPSIPDAKCREPW
jgi:hypothetical protein